MTTATQPATVSPAMVRALVDQARDKNYPSGVLGIRARAGSAEVSTFDHGGQPVVVVPCESALAVREALLDRPAAGWLVVITDRTEEDLGSGLLAHLVGQQLRTPDPWQAVRQRFHATGLDSLLTAVPRSREVAYGLLEATPADGWTAAPAGVLTRDHALGSVARAWLDLPDGPADLLSVLGWTTKPATVTKIADLRELVSDVLADTVLRWIGDNTGYSASLVNQLLRSGNTADVVPLGLVLDILHDAADSGQQQQRHAAGLAKARLEHRWGQVPDSALWTTGAAATTVAATLLTDSRTRPVAERLLARADVLIRESQAEALTEGSDLLRSGFASRIHRLADLLRDDPLARLPAIEEAWQQVSRHALASGDSRIGAFQAAVRLSRWLSWHRTAAPPDMGLASLARRQIDVDGWVDSAINDAAAGVDDAELGAGLARVLTLVREIRDQHDTEFATALAEATTADSGADRGFIEHDGARVWVLERLLPDVVIPLAKQRPVLFLILDGMSTGVSTEVIGDVLDRTGSGWAEELLDGSGRRAAGLAVLPTLTEVSRASLLCGELTTGQQDGEQRGYRDLTNASGLGRAPLFHKKILDTTRLGYSLSDEVRSAVDDTDGQQLVTCILNTIDDALDRSDPAGTPWTADTVKHLRPLLDRARDVGRTVVITADHGHVVERRLGSQRGYPDISSGRSRAATGVAGPDEVLVEGTRVLKHGGRAILAVSERLRYGPLKAGYHGGAAPAEAIVPVAVLVPAEVADEKTPRLAAPQAPPWWSMPVDPAEVQQSGPAKTVAAERVPTLFDEPFAVSGAPVTRSALGDRVVSTDTYERQRQIAGRIALTDVQIANVVNLMMAAPQRRLTAQQTAAALGISQTRVTGAIGQVSKLLNVEGYPIIRLDTATTVMILDEQLLREQYGVSP